MSQSMRFPTIWYMRPAKPQISLRIRAVWSEPLLVAWIFYDYQATGRTLFGVSKLERRLHRLVLVYTCQNATLLDITCHGSIINLTGRAPATETTSSHKKPNTEINEPKPQEEKTDVSINLNKVTLRNANPETMDSFAPSDCTFNAPANLASFVFKPLSPASAASFLYPNQDTCSSFLDTIPNR